MAALLFCGLFATSADAVERVPLADAGESFAGAPEVQDSIVRRSARASADTGEGPAPEDGFTTADGYVIEARSNYYGREEIQEVVNVVAALEHGPELGTLSIFVATPEQLDLICGDGNLACYAPGSGEMIVSGEEGPVSGVPRDFVIAHEYGHHIANNRTGNLWSALEAGTVRWATRERVCQLVRRGELFPGGSGDRYWRNPGEAFAEAFAQMSFPSAGVGWGFYSDLTPDAGAFEQIRADIGGPWTGPRATTWADGLAPLRRSNRRLRTAAGRRQLRKSRLSLARAQALGPVADIASRRVPMPLDGTVDLTLAAPAGVSYELRVEDPRTGRVLSSSLTDASGAASISYTSCGHSALQLEVEQVRGSGPFTVGIQTP